jgi:hypothetical protein
MKEVQREVQSVIRKGKEEYKKKVEEHFTGNNMKKAWEGLSIMSGFKGNKGGGSVEKSSATQMDVNELNQFYARFDKHDFSDERENIREKLTSASGPTEGESPIVVTEEEVLRGLKGVNASKAGGPDGMRPRVLKHCAEELSYIFSVIFNLSLSVNKVPALWKTSCIVPVPKKKSVQTMNDLRPVALTSVCMKVFERIVLFRLSDFVKDFVDPCQFAYRRNRSVDDAVLYVLNKIYSHLDKLGTYIRLMFFDFSSAFNTIQPHLMADKLFKMNVPASTILWVMDYLTSRPQYVRMGDNLVSDTVCTNTGAPQGTVLSPFLFSLYTADFRISSDSCPMVKFADDTGLTGLLTDDDDSDYRREVDRFVGWCDDNFLELNVGKTMEMIIDNRRKQHVHGDIIIKGEVVEKVEQYKYLGIIIDNKLTWKPNTDAIVKKLHSRLYFLRKLRSFNVRQEILQMFYTSTCNSVLYFGSVCWSGNISKQDRDRLEKFIKKASGVVGRKQDTFTSTHERRLTDRIQKILADDTHPLRPEFDSRRIDRSSRFRQPCTRTTRYRNSFIPSAIHIFNSHVGR